MNALFRVSVWLRWARCVLGHNNDEVLLVRILKLSEGSLKSFPKGSRGSCQVLTGCFLSLAIVKEGFCAVKGKIVHDNPTKTLSDLETRASKEPETFDNASDKRGIGNQRFHLVDVSN